MPENVVYVDELFVQFDDFVAVDKVSFTVDAGEVRGVLGGNGAGKSTTLRVLGGVIRPTSGEVRIGGQPVSTFSGGNKARQVTGYCPDVGGLVSGASPLEHVKLLAQLRRDKELYEVGKREIHRFNLGEFQNTPITGFSHGMLRRLSVMLAFISAKNLLILDEPFDGVDPLGVEIINEVIREAKQRGVAVLISTHLQNLLVDVSDSINVMAKGHLLEVVEAGTLEGEGGVARYTELLRGAG